MLEEMFDWNQNIISTIMLNKRHQTCMLHVLTLLIQQMFYNNIWTFSRGFKGKILCLPLCFFLVPRARTTEPLKNAHSVAKGNIAKMLHTWPLRCATGQEFVNFLPIESCFALANVSCYFSRNVLKVKLNSVSTASCSYSYISSTDGSFWSSLIWTLSRRSRCFWNLQL